MMSSECPHGHQALDGYLLPVNLLAGATFDPAMVRAAYRVSGRQLQNMGVDLALMSMLDVLRDPRWGRSEECYSEDPYLSARMAEAAVIGMQESGPEVVAKAFCSTGRRNRRRQCERGKNWRTRTSGNSFSSGSGCNQGRVKGIMAAYNEIDGVYCHANRWLLNDVIRKEMGFDGIVMSDGVAIDQLDSMTGDNVVSGALALQSGVDVGLWDEAFGKLEEAVRRGLVKEAQIDQAVLRVLTLKFERGLFEHPYLEEEGEIHMDYAQNPESVQLAREGLVILQNKNQVLPVWEKSGIR